MYRCAGEATGDDESRSRMEYRILIWMGIKLFLSERSGSLVS